MTRWTKFFFQQTILLISFALFSRPIVAQSPSVATYPVLEMVDSPQTLLFFGSEWSMWADETFPPENWPPVSEVETTRDVTELLAEDHEESSDRYIHYGSEAAPGSNWQWTSVMTPVVGRSESTHLAHMDRWEREERRRIRRQRNPPQRTTLLYENNVEATRGGMNDPVEPGPQTLYFSRTFEVQDAASLAALQISTEFSGGIIVYLNGEEVLRHHVASNRENYGDPATPFWLEDWVYQTSANRWERSWLGVDPGLLQTGMNTIAVALHKRPAGGTKAFFFDIQVDGYSQAGMTKTPYLQSLDHNSIIVDWETNIPAFGYVEFGIENEGFSRTVTSAEVAGTFHEVHLTNLTPNTRYYYRVHSFPVSFDANIPPSEAIVSETRHFITSVESGTSFSFVAYGDTRTQEDVHSSIAEQMWNDIQQNDARFVLHTGDLTTTGASWDQWQNEFFTPALPLMGYIPFYTSLGNHEGNHEMYYRYLSLPGNESWYSFIHGDVEFFAMNTGFNYREGSMQHRWLEAALAASTSTWKVVFFHHPPYSCSPSRKPGDEEVQLYIVPLLEQYGVDVVFLGHDHFYARTFEINGVFYITTGGGGAPSYPIEPDDISEVCYREYHYCLIDVTENSFVVRAISLDGIELDRLELRTNRSPRTGLR